MFTKSESLKAAIAAELVAAGDVLHIVGNTETGAFHIVTREGSDVYVEMLRTGSGALIARRA